MSAAAGEFCLSGYRLRLAIEADLPAIVAIYNSIIPGRMVTAELEPVTVEGRRPWFAAHDPQTRPLWVLVETATDAVVAWMSFDTFNARAAYNGTVMIALYLAETHRRRGLGQALVQHALAVAPRHGVHTILGYIFAHNAPSLLLFERLGFARWALLPRVAILDGVERDLVIVGRRAGA
ncbi:MAG: N-acetyltransferase [Opitutae bacterium]|nr:N-acetyltransferase [Opitutae bacterium]